MKHILIVYLLLTAGISAFGEQNLLEIQKLSVNLAGVAFNGKSLVAYGEGGIILRSVNKGTDWEQKHIDPNDANIVKICDFEGDYYGILEKDILIKSVDNGVNWSLIRVDSNKVFKSISVGSSGIYILTKNAINVYDMSINLLKSIPFDPSLNYNSLSYYNNKLYATGDSGKICVYEIDKDFKLSFIDFKSLNICDTCQTMRQLYVDSNSMFVMMARNLFSSSDNGKSWKYCASDFDKITVHDGICYNISSYSAYPQLVSYPIFSKYNDGKVSRIDKNTYSRFVNVLYYNDCIFLDKDTIVTVANDKTIIRSTDAGLNWNYISNLFINISKMYWVDEKHGYVSSQNGQIFKTSDGGVTFLPQNYDALLSSSFMFFNSIVFNDKGEGVLFYSSDSPGHYNFVYTKNYGDDYIGFCNSDFTGVIFESEPKLFIGSNYFAFTNYHTAKNHFTQLSILDKNMLTFKNMRFDSLSFQFIRLDKNTGEFSAFAIERRYPNKSNGFDSLKFYLMTSKQNGNVWEKTMAFDLKYPPYFGVTNFKNKYIISTGKYDSTNFQSNYFNILDPISKTISPLYYIGCNAYGYVFDLNGTAYIIGRKILFYNNDLLSKPDAWKSDSLHNYTFESTNFSFNDVVYNRAIDKNKKECIFKITKSKPTNVNESEIFRTYLFTEHPYPIPAKNNISIDIVADLRYDIKNIKIAIFDITGHQLDSEGKVAFEISDISSGKIKWDCGGVPPGEYFISVTHADVSKIIPVIVQR